LEQIQRLRPNSIPKSIQKKQCAGKRRPQMAQNKEGKKYFRITHDKKAQAAGSSSRKAGKHEVLN
jgi:hypothetical protein